jgi:SlyX protein
MTSPDSLEARVAELETRVAFQEHSLGELSDALAEARLEIDRYARALSLATSELRQLRSLVQSHDPGDEPPPPHY